MDVKISYRVPFEEIPATIQRMIVESRNKLEETTELLNQHQVNNNNAMAVLRDIEHVRKIMLRVDNQLSDCYNILAGYNKALADAAIPQQEEEQHAVPVESNPEQG